MRFISVDFADNMRSSKMSHHIPYVSNLLNGVESTLLYEEAHKNNVLGTFSASFDGISHFFAKKRKIFRFSGTFVWNFMIFSEEKFVWDKKKIRK